MKKYITILSTKNNQKLKEESDKDNLKIEKKNEFKAFLKSPFQPKFPTKTLICVQSPGI